MKLFFLFLLLFPLSNFSQDKAVSTKPQVIIDSRDLSSSEQLLVESGEIRLAGRSHVERSRAERLWEDACSAWRKEMRALNRRNLLLLHCGVPELKSLKEAGETLYRYESTAEFRIRVSSR